MYTNIYKYNISTWDVLCTPQVSQYESPSSLSLPPSHHPSFPLPLQKLSRKVDLSGTLLKLPGLDEKLNAEFHEELRCVIHLWLLLLVAADGRLRREKVLFQKFLRETRFQLLSNGIAPPKNIFSSASFASINVTLVAVWLSTLTPEERERFHLLQANFRYVDNRN